MRYFFIACCFLSPAISHGQADTKVAVQKIEPLHIAKGTAIEIEAYDSATDTFEVLIVKEPGVGPNVVATEALVSSLGLSLSVNEFKKKKSEYQGSEFTLKQALRLLQMEEIAARKNKKK